MPFWTDDHESPNWITANLANLVRRMTPSCREVSRLTSKGRDRLLPLGSRLRLALHCCFCKWCARYANQLQLLHEATHLFVAPSIRLTDRPSTPMPRRGLSAL